MKDTSREENGSSKVDRILVSFTLFIPFSYRPVTVPPGGMEGEEMNRVNHARLCRSVPVTHILTLSGRSLQSQPFHRESFYVTGTPPLLTLLAHSSRPSAPLCEA